MMYQFPFTTEKLIIDQNGLTRNDGPRDFLPDYQGMVIPHNSKVVLENILTLLEDNTFHLFLEVRDGDFKN